MEHLAITYWVSVLALSAVLVAAFCRVGLSSILAYLLVGVLAGPSVFGWVSEASSLATAAEFGVVLLMFTIGLEFSFTKLLSAKRLVLGVGASQVIMTTAVLAVVILLFGMKIAEVVIVALALAMSSTAIVLKYLNEHHQLATPSGRIVTGILLFQDIAAIPILVALPVLATNSGQLFATLSFTFLKAALVFACLFAAAYYLLPGVLTWVARQRSLELFMLVALLLAVFAAAISVEAGLPPTFGAFMAGALLGETRFKHQIEEDIRPFRDLLLGVFFTSVGLQFTPQIFAQSPLMIGGILIALIALKSILLIPIIKRFGHTLNESIRASLCLAQGGEFGLLILVTAISLGLLNEALGQAILAAIIISMFFAPIILRFNESITNRLMGKQANLSGLNTENTIASLGANLKQHVIVVGYGRLGQNTVEILNEEGVEVIALDLDPIRVAEAQAAGRPVVFGNAFQPGVLRAAGIHKAKAVAITLSDTASAKRIVHFIRTLNVDARVLVRSNRSRDDEELIQSGVHVFPEGLESSLAFSAQLLTLMGVPINQVENRVSQVRKDDYDSLRYFFHSSDEEKASQQDLDYPEQFRSVVIEESYSVVGQCVSSIFENNTGVKLVDIRRGAIKLSPYEPNLRLRAGDVLVLQGTNEELDILISKIVEGG